jgi:hypothetical protein
LREACSLVWSVLVLLFRSRVSLEAEILILRHQFNIQRPHLPKRLAFSTMDRLIFVGLYRLVPNTIKALMIVKPDTMIRWHRVCFRLYWRWKSQRSCGRPTVPLEIRRPICEMSIAFRQIDSVRSASRSTLSPAGHTDRLLSVASCVVLFRAGVAVLAAA